MAQQAPCTCCQPTCQRTPQCKNLFISTACGGGRFTYVPEGGDGDRALMFADEIRGRLVTLMGGRAAEMLTCAQARTAFEYVYGH